MKAKLEYCLRWLREGAVRVVRSYPVETLLALYACIRCLLTYELDWSEEELFNRLGLVPLFFALALAVNNLAGRGPWRKVYWVVWAPIVPLTLWSGLGDWIESASFRHFARHTGAAAVAVEPAGRAQRPVRQRRARLAALGCAGPAVRQCRAGAVLCDTLFGDLYLRPRRSVDRTRRGVGRDDLRDAGRAAAVPDDGRPLAGRRTARAAASSKCC